MIKYNAKPCKNGTKHEFVMMIVCPEQAFRAQLRCMGRTEDAQHSGGTDVIRTPKSVQLGDFITEERNAPHRLIAESTESLEREYHHSEDSHRRLE